MRRRTRARGQDPDQPIRVLFVVQADGLALDWAGSAEALRIANGVLTTRGLAPRFALEFVGPETNPATSVGVRLCGIAPLPDPRSLDLDARIWIVLIGQRGDTIDTGSPAAGATLSWLSQIELEAGRTELVCICAGSVLAARAGLLDGHEATTHHHHIDELVACAPKTRVLANRVFVASGAVWSSAGVTTGIDLTLHRIAEECGADIAARVAQTMAVALRRGPLDPELSPFLSARDHLHAGLHRVQDAICQDPASPWPVTRMAELACTSSRHLCRLFTEHAGVSPLNYLTRIRVHVAQNALRRGMAVARAAEEAGFGSDTQLRRAWQLHGPADCSPGAVRSAARKRAATA